MPFPFLSSMVTRVTRCCRQEIPSIGRYSGRGDKYRSFSCASLAISSLYIKLRTSPGHRAGTRVHLFDEPSEHGGQKATSSTRLDRFKKLALCLPLFLSFLE